MKYFLAQIGILLFVAAIEITIGKWVSGWVIIPSLIAILTIFVISSHYHEYRFSDTPKVIDRAKFMLKNLGIFSVVFAILVLLYFRYGGERFPQPLEKPLHITMKNDLPCFYIEPFVGMETFEIHGIQIIKPPEPYERYWGIGYFADKYKQIKIPFSSFIGEAQCIP